MHLSRTAFCKVGEESTPYLRGRHVFVPLMMPMKCIRQDWASRNHSKDVRFYPVDDVTLAGIGLYLQRTQMCCCKLLKVLHFLAASADIETRHTDSDVERSSTREYTEISNHSVSLLS